jgi:hypothetical protein
MYSKNQRYVMFGYLAFMAVSMWLKHHGETVHISSPLDGILGAAVPLLFGVFAIQNGWIGARYAGPIYREEAPVSFWFWVVFALLFGAGMFLWGLRDAFHSIR